MSKAETIAALQEKTQAADRASNFLRGLIAELNDISDTAALRMRDMTLATRQGRGKDSEQDRH